MCRAQNNWIFVKELQCFKRFDYFSMPLCPNIHLVISRTAVVLYAGVTYELASNQLRRPLYPKVLSSHLAALIASAKLPL